MNDFCWLVCTSDYVPTGFDQVLEDFIGPGGVLEPLRQGRQLAVRAMVGARVLHAKVTTPQPRLTRLRTAVDSSRRGFSLTFWYSPEGVDAFRNDPEVSEVALFAEDYQRRGHVLISFAGRRTDAAMAVSVVAAIAQRWGVDFGGAWFGKETVGPYCAPELEAQIGVTVFPETLGPTWLMVLRPDVATRFDSAWRHAHALTPRVVRVPGPTGMHEVWQLIDEPRDLDQSEAQRWVAALGDAMPLGMP